jgi:hypothetical protein
VRDQSASKWRVSLMSAGRPSPALNNFPMLSAAVKVKHFWLYACYQ